MPKQKSNHPDRPPARMTEAAPAKAKKPTQAEIEAKRTAAENV